MEHFLGKNFLSEKFSELRNQEHWTKSGRFWTLNFNLIPKNWFWYQKLVDSRFGNFYGILFSSLSFQKTIPWFEDFKNRPFLTLSIQIFFLPSENSKFYFEMKMVRLNFLSECRKRSNLFAVPRTDFKLLGISSSISDQNWELSFLNRLKFESNLSLRCFRLILIFNINS